ncbi:hypothetical protein RIB2604_01706750 [Aspergillus luchuensis]|uniref:Uncharacterized protein n=1 Tax=Aspergillus kawachii TaxID=1069201 RepID=A0A146FCB5_ASPKA|nr:hypothetical protein RIB2604_01706750 [Aspergillus luchuensis]
MSMTLGTKAKGEPIAIKGRCSMTSLVAVGLMGDLSRLTRYGFLTQLESECVKGKPRR